MPEHELHSNPLAPSDDEMEDDDKLHGKLSNDDFRKLLMTPRAASAASSLNQASASFAKPKPVEKKDTSDAHNARKKKKSYYAQLKKEEDEREKELATKYRDRARERRDGLNSDQGQPADISTTANYKAVAPDAKIGQSLAERRKQVIEESKYLGGDMEHTHLVKGLDYALLEKVKAEIATHEIEELEAVIKSKNKDTEDDLENITFGTEFARNIIRAALWNKGPVKRNDLFIPGRKSYLFDLDDPDQEIPTAIIRSKADCAGMETSTALSNNDIIVNKVVKIFTDLRMGRGRDKRKKDKKEKEKSRKDEGHLENLNPNEDIFENAADLAEYKQHHKRRRHDKREDGVKRSYFEKPYEEESKYNEAGPKLSAKEFVRDVNERLGKGGWNGVDDDDDDDDDDEKAKAPSKEQQERIKKFHQTMEIDSYAECYPGMMESVDAFGDSDDEADYTKMDQGNKKGPVGRWDFETQEEYSSYMSSREALPKAAFQYGVKMADGRKTRRAGPRDEKKELDREWTKIQNIINKRKTDQGDISGATKKTKF